MNQYLSSSFWFKAGAKKTILSSSIFCCHSARIHAPRLWATTFTLLRWYFLLKASKAEINSSDCFAMVVLLKSPSESPHQEKSNLKTANIFSVKSCVSVLNFFSVEEHLSNQWRQTTQALQFQSFGRETIPLITVLSLFTTSNNSVFIS